MKYTVEYEPNLSLRTLNYINRNMTPYLKGDSTRMFNLSYIFVVYPDMDLKDVKILDNLKDKGVDFIQIGSKILLEISKENLIEWYYRSGSDEENKDFKLQLSENVISQLEKEGSCNFKVTDLLDEICLDAIPQKYFKELDCKDEGTLGDLDYDFEVTIEKSFGSKLKNLVGRSFQGLDYLMEELRFISRESPIFTNSSDKYVYKEFKTFGIEVLFEECTFIIQYLEDLQENMMIVEVLEYKD